MMRRMLDIGTTSGRLVKKRFSSLRPSFLAISTLAFSADSLVSFLKHKNIKTKYTIKVASC